MTRHPPRGLSLTSLATTRHGAGAFVARRQPTARPCDAVSGAAGSGIKFAIDIAL